MNESELIELLATAEHASWARWMEYLFSRCQKGPNGHLVIPRELVQRWQRQVETPYANLTEEEKRSDRIEVAHILPVICEYAASQNTQLALVACEIPKKTYRVWTHLYGDLHIEMPVEATSHEQAKAKFVKEFGYRLGDTLDPEDCTSVEV